MTMPNGNVFFILQHRFCDLWKVLCGSERKGVCDMVFFPTKSGTGSRNSGFFGLEPKRFYKSGTESSEPVHSTRQNILHLCETRNVLCIALWQNVSYKVVLEHIRLTACL